MASPDMPVDMLGALLAGRLGGRLEGGLQLSPSEDDDKEADDGALTRPPREGSCLWDLDRLSRWPMIRGSLVWDSASLAGRGTEGRYGETRVGAVAPFVLVGALRSVVGAPWEEDPLGFGVVDEVLDIDLDAADCGGLSELSGQSPSF
jgi:hypothetical protein